MTRASESGHWYDRDGTPRYEVPRADGSGMRAATLADARKHGWYPGVTTILKCAAAPQLVDWMIDQAILAALTLPRTEGLSHEDLMRVIRADSQEQASKARKDGTDIHAAIQGHYEGKPPNEEFWPFVKGVTETLMLHCGEQEWIAEKPCAHPLGFGTKADLSCPAWILDFKGKDFTKADVPKLKTWDDHALQLAATREALRLPGTPCAIVYVSRTVKGLAKVCPIDEPELERGWDCFRALHAYWSNKNRYFPMLWKPAEKEAA